MIGFSRNLDPKDYKHLAKMSENMSNDIAIIPARGGSKRIPRKNIIDFCKTIRHYFYYCRLINSIF